MATIPSFQHATAAYRTFCGPKALAALPRELDRLGSRRAVIFGGPWLVALPEDVDADAVIAVGGGSSIVTARAATILLAEKKDARELCTQRGDDGKLVSPRLSAPKIPNWVIPSTPITAYAKAGSAVSDPATGERLALYDPKTRAQGIFLDPEVALSAPVGLASTASLNAFSMAVECIEAGVDDPLADALLLHALRLLTEWMPRLRSAPDDP